VLAGQEDTDWAWAELLAKVVSGDFSQVVASLESKAIESHFRVIEWTATDYDCIDAAVVSRADYVECVSRANWRILLFHHRPNA
jgi:hypothetical protein